MSESSAMVPSYMPWFMGFATVFFFCDDSENLTAQEPMHVRINSFFEAWPGASKECWFDIYIYTSVVCLLYFRNIYIYIVEYIGEYLYGSQAIYIYMYTHTSLSTFHFSCTYPKAFLLKKALQELASAKPLEVTLFWRMCHLRGWRLNSALCRYPESSLGE